MNAHTNSASITTRKRKLFETKKMFLWADYCFTMFGHLWLQWAETSFYIRIENIGTKTLLAVNRSYIFYSNILRLGSWIEEAAENMMHNQLPIEWGEKKLFLIILKSPKTCNQSERIVYWLNVTDGKDISFKYFNLFFLLIKIGKLVLLETP